MYNRVNSYKGHRLSMGRSIPHSTFASSSMKRATIQTLKHAMTRIRHISPPSTANVPEILPPEVSGARKVPQSRIGFLTPPVCRDGTRELILADIKTWVLDAHLNAPAVLLLDGVAGAGKSTIASSIAAWAVSMNILGAAIFLEWAHPPSPRDLFAEITKLLAASGCTPDIYGGIGAVIGPRRDWPRDGEVLVRQWIVEPVLRLKPAPSPPILIIVDAFDSIREGDIDEVVRALLALLVGLPSRFKIFLTTRAAPWQGGAIDRHAKHLTKNLSLSDKDKAASVRADIRGFIRSSLANRFGPSEEFGATEAQLDALADRANLSFGAAEGLMSTIVGCWKRDAPWAGIEQTLESQPSPGSVRDKQTEDWYARILCTDVVQQDYGSGFQDLLGTIVHSTEQHDRKTLAALLRQTDEEQEDLFKVLEHVLEIQDPPKFTADFLNFVYNKQRCVWPDWVIDPAARHEHIAIRCFAFLGWLELKKLTNDKDETMKICRDYAEGNWVYHLARAKFFLLVWVLDKDVPVDSFTSRVKVIGKTERGIEELKLLHTAMVCSSTLA